MASLSVPELKKRNNFSLFLGRIRSNKEFTLIDNRGKVKLDKKLVTQIKTINDLSKFKMGQSILLPTDKGSDIKLNDIYKDSLFSGRTQSTTAKEDAEVVSLNEQLNKIKDKLGVDFITLKVGKQKYQVSLCESTPGTPKCDFHFKGSSEYGGHVSHKAGNGPRGFQQWSGTSQRVEPSIFSHPETQDFINSLKSKYPNGMPSGTTVGRKIKDEKLKNLAVYGNGYGGRQGENNVDTTMQGNLNIVKNGNLYVLKASNHENINGQKVTGSYEPIFLAVYKGDRSDHGIKGARITINPMGGRTVKEFI
jgi:hypothetical protein